MDRLGCDVGSGRGGRSRQLFRGWAQNSTAPLPTISRKVSELESHLKTQLLIRHHPQADFDRCRRSLRRRQQTHSRAGGGEAERAASGEYGRGAARRSRSPTAPIGVRALASCRSAVTEFLKSYPEVDVQALLNRTVTCI